MWRSSFGSKPVLPIWSLSLSTESRWMTRICVDGEPKSALLSHGCYEEHGLADQERGAS